MSMDQMAWILAGFLLKEAFSAIKGFRSETKTESKEMIQEIQKLAIAIVELRVEMKHLSIVLELIPKLQRDVDAAHTAIRELKLSDGRQDS